MDHPELHEVVAVEPRGDHRLYLRFDDGTEGVIDLARRLRYEGVFAPLRDQAYFDLVRLAPESGTICWPSGADIAPETLYAAVVDSRSAA
jgi:hypothetical protein